MEVYISLLKVVIVDKTETDRVMDTQSGGSNC